MRPDVDDLTGIGLALALGLLVGVQRGWVLRREATGTRFAGVRTFALLGLAGGMAGTLHAPMPALAVVILAGSAALVVLGYWRSSGQSDQVSGTSSLVGLITLACGYLAGSGAYAFASAAAGSTVLVLAMRRQLHAWVRELDEEEVQAIARFGLIALVILPLLPDAPFGPYLAWRPRQLWLVVVMVCGFSFAGYLAAKRLGATKGTLATAAAGSMVSSTAVTAAMAAKLRDDSAPPALLNAAVALASAVMFVRIIVLTAALAGFAVAHVVLWAVPGMLVSLVAAVLIGRAHLRPGAAAQANAGDDAEMALRNPFALGPALVLMGLVMGMTLIARWVLLRYGNAGLATVLAITGTLDVDSAIITMGNLPAGTLSARVGALVLMPPVLLNTAFKAGTAITLAGWRKAWPGAASLAASIAACVATLPLLL